MLSSVEDGNFCDEVSKFGLYLHRLGDRRLSCWFSATMTSGDCSRLEPSVMKWKPQILCQPYSNRGHQQDCDLFLQTLCVRDMNNNRDFFSIGMMNVVAQYLKSGIIRSNSAVNILYLTGPTKA